MASHLQALGRAAALPLSEVLASIPSYPRPVVERLVARMIELLDQDDGDPDLEEDDPGGQCDEDEINTGIARIYEQGRSLEGAGCPISAVRTNGRDCPHSHHLFFG